LSGYHPRGAGRTGESLSRTSRKDPLNRKQVPKKQDGTVPKKELPRYKGLFYFQRSYNNGMKFKKGTRRRAIEYEKDLVQYWKQH
jgi:hypothetical protein